MFNCSYLTSISKCRLLNDNLTVTYGIIGYGFGITYGIMIYNLCSNKYKKILEPLSYYNKMFNLYSMVGLCSGIYIGYKKRQ